MASLPFVDVLYIRCDWRDVQTEPGKLNLHPVFALTLDAAKRHNLRVAFRVQMSNTEGQPGRLALPDFLQNQVPLVKIGKTYGAKEDFVEPRYDDPKFQNAFRELNELLVREFDDKPLMEFVDLMMYGFWGEGHTSNLRIRFPDYLTAAKTSLAMTKVQLDLWKKVPLAVNTQPDISSVGNREVQDLCVRSGCWLRSDSIVIEERFRSKSSRTGRRGWRRSWKMVTTGNTRSTRSICRLTKPGSTYSKTGCSMQSISVRTTGRSGPSLTICGVTTSVTQTALTRCDDGSVIACAQHGSGNENDTGPTRSSLLFQTMV
jgi:hypothetical protein